MHAEGNLKSKTFYKIFLLLLKALPFLLALISVFNTLLSYFAIDLVILSYIGGISLLPVVFMYLAAYVFKFCIYHRIFLDYTVVSNIIAVYDYYIGIPVGDAGLMTMQLVLFFIAIVIALIAHLEHKNNDT